MRILVAFFKSKDLSLVIGEPFSAYRPSQASSAEYRRITPRIRKDYEEMIKRTKEEGLQNTVSKFLEQTSASAIFDASLVACIADDLELERTDVEDALMRSEYMDRRLEFLKKNQYKTKKEDPLKYAESFGEIASLLGTRRGLSLLRQRGFGIAESTLRALMKVSMMPLPVKQAIQDGRLKLTLAFELPLDSADNIEIIMAKISGLAYVDAKKALRELAKA